VARGYLEGPASEERDAAFERGDHLEQERPRERRAVYGSTPDDPEQHFIGWLGEVDPDKLFESGRAWGLSVRLMRVD
jgi:predicted nucleotidyltransferase